MDSLHDSKFGLSVGIKASLDAFARCSQCCIFAMEQPSGRMVYASPNLTKVYGLSLNQIYEKGLNLIYSSFETKESHGLITANNRANEFLETLPAIERPKFIISYSYHLTVEGRRVLVTHRCTPIAQDVDNGKWLILNLMYFSLAKKADKYYIIHESNGQQECRVFNQRTLKWESHAPSLSKNHLDILHLASCGYAEKEIAEEMNKSVSTIKFHKKSICELMGVQTMHEALGQCLSLGLFY